MCHHIGYKGYYQFRITLARDIGKKQYQQSEISKSSGSVEETFKVYANNISAILEKR